MKKLLVITCLLIGGMGISQAQQTTPVWPGCEGAEDIKACFNQQLSKHVQEHYEYPMNDNNEYVRGKVTISFDINEKGEVEINSVEGDKPKVVAAAKKMILKIPDMEPGTRKGEPASRTFTVPFNF